MASTEITAGWYPDPADAARERYWDGDGWTVSVRPATTASATVADPADPEPAPAEATARSVLRRILAGVAAFAIVAVGGIGLDRAFSSPSTDSPTDVTTTVETATTDPGGSPASTTTTAAPTTTTTEVLAGDVTTTIVVTTTAPVTASDTSTVACFSDAAATTVTGCDQPHLAELVSFPGTDPVACWEHLAAGGVITVTVDAAGNRTVAQPWLTDRSFVTYSGSVACLVGFSQPHAGRVLA